MRPTTTIETTPARRRRHVCAALWAVLALGAAGATAGAAAVSREFAQTDGPAPIVREAPPRAAAAPANGFVPRSGQNQEHLQQWMRSHSNLTLEQQQRALTSEPGFQQLKPEVQQRMHERLAQLHGMTPEQRQRALSRTEAMERLAPEQRQQVRNALTGLGALPKDRRMFVAQQFRALRNMTPVERQAYWKASGMRAQFSEEEWQTLNGLLEAAPYLPPPQQQPRETTVPAVAPAPR